MKKYIYIYKCSFIYFLLISDNSSKNKQWKPKEMQQKVIFYNIIKENNATKRLTESPEVFCKKAVLQNFA